ncbi:MAG: GyrI-like domain-containing protein [Anaerolineae bacterium]|jgi:DNA gyrase inhibitor GyrI|nr:GyrI-like domain-containing protein [Anaerolineae bacterium]
MDTLEVRIVKLEPMRVASVYGFGASPEGEAIGKLAAWAGPKGLLDVPGQHRIFGFNAPNPSAGSPNYGYEMWITVGPEVEPDGEVRVQEFPGGLYAVTQCKGVETITATWKRLIAWLTESKYKHADHQWLEEQLTPLDTALDELTLDLYAPIAE